MAKRLFIPSNRKLFTIRDAIIPDDFKEENQLINTIWNLNEDRFQDTLSLCTQYINVEKSNIYFLIYSIIQISFHRPKTFDIYYIFLHFLK